MQVYRSPVETLCTNIDYFIPDNKGATKSFDDDAMARLREFRSIIELSWIEFCVRGQTSHASVLVSLEYFIYCYIFLITDIYNLVSQKSPF